MQREVHVPDIGDFEDVDVVEVVVGEGDRVEVDDPLVTLESDKASMEIPSPEAGVVRKVAVSVGDKVSEGTLLVVLEVAEEEAAQPERPEPDASAGDAEPAEAAQPKPDADAPEAPSREERAGAAAAEPERAARRDVLPDPTRRPGEAARRPPPVSGAPDAPASPPHASPLVRRFARELGVDLGRTGGSGPHGRILEEDVRAYVRDALSGLSAGAVSAAEAAEDPARFGCVETRELDDESRAAGARLHRAWLATPLGVHHGEADVTALEVFSKERAPERGEEGADLPLLAFVMKACVQGLRLHPALRSSLSPEGGQLVERHYFHFAVLADAGDRARMPVVREVDRKGARALAGEIAELAAQAREGTLARDAQAGASFALIAADAPSGAGSLPMGGDSGVATLLLSGPTTRARWRKGEDGSGPSFVPRRILSLSLSYDARVVHAAGAARFLADVAHRLAEPARLLL